MIDHKALRKRIADLLNDDLSDIKADVRKMNVPALQFEVEEARRHLGNAFNILSEE